MAANAIAHWAELHGPELGEFLTGLLFGFPLGIRSTVNASLEDLVLALKLVLEFVLEITHFSVVDIHGLGAVTTLEGAIPILVGDTLRHCACLSWECVTGSAR